MVTITGNAKTNRPLPKFDSTSLPMDGSGDYLRPAIERRCWETGQVLPPNAPANSRFISQDARYAWGNRRKLRGADLLDLLFAWRYDRPLSAKFKLLTMACRMLKKWHDEDKAVGRVSAAPPESLIEREF